MKFTYYPTIEIPIKAKNREEAWKKAEEFDKDFDQISLTAKKFKARKILDGELEEDHNLSINKI